MPAPAAYYNEHEPYAADWLRNLIAAGHIAAGEVDERDIRDVSPAELTAFTQCHFFAGIGIWSAALRSAGWPDDRPVWTGSCPCQPFSAAGAGEGFDDERHLWPHWHWLISNCRPRAVMGEQVASPDGLGWFDLVSSDLEGTGYAGGAVDLCSAGFGAPNIRQRLYFAFGRNSPPPPQRVANTHERGQSRSWKLGRPSHSTKSCKSEIDRVEHDGRHDRLGITSSAGPLSSPLRPISCGKEGAGSRNGEPERSSPDGGVADTDGKDEGGRGIQRRGKGNRQNPRPARERSERLRSSDGVADTVPTGRSERRTKSGNGSLAGNGTAGGLADANESFTGKGLQRGGQQRGFAGDQQDCTDNRTTVRSTPTGRSEISHSRAGPTNGFWADADWLLCRDPDGPKFRPVEPGTFPLASGHTARVGKLRAYGNAINKEVATGFISAVMDDLL